MTSFAPDTFTPQFEQFIRRQAATDPAHDLTHIQRVVAAAKQFCYEEKANLAVVLPAAWLHDCVTLPKNHPERHHASAMAAQTAIAFLQSIHYPAHYFPAITHAIEAHSFSAQIPVQTLEAAIVQDADRIDALGAIGIARCIQVSVGFQAALYSADDPFGEHRPRDDKAFCIDHFFTKLFRLEATMNTTAGMREARIRTEYMKGFLAQLGHEINVPFHPD